MLNRVIEEVIIQLLASWIIELMGWAWALIDPLLCR